MQPKRRRKRERDREKERERERERERDLNRTEKGEKRVSGWTAQTAALPVVTRKPHTQHYLSSYSCTKRFISKSNPMGS